MSLKVIGAGLGRTGTASLKVALEQLGIGRCYHMGEVGNNMSHMDKWLSAANGNPDWKEIFKGFEATVDYPACNFWKELAGAYPEAKVILTVRDANDWFDSANATIMSPMFIEWTKKSPHWDFMKEAVLMGIDENLYERSFMVPHFEQHNAAVKQAVSNERLLVYEVKEGWKPLCNFLGLPIPDEPFPRVNSRKETEELIQSFTAHPPEEEMDQEVQKEYVKQLFTENREK